MRVEFSLVLCSPTSSRQRRLHEGQWGFNRSKPVYSLRSRKRTMHLFQVIWLALRLLTSHASSRVCDNLFPSPNNSRVSSWGDTLNLCYVTNYSLLERAWVLRLLLTLLTGLDCVQHFNYSLTTRLAYPLLIIWFSPLLIPTFFILNVW